MVYKRETMLKEIQSLVTSLSFYRWNIENFIVSLCQCQLKASSSFEYREKRISYFIERRLALRQNQYYAENFNREI